MGEIGSRANEAILWRLPGRVVRARGNLSAPGAAPCDVALRKLWAPLPPYLGNCHLVLHVQRVLFKSRRRDNLNEGRQRDVRFLKDGPGKARALTVSELPHFQNIRGDVLLLDFLRRDLVFRGRGVCERVLVNGTAVRPELLRSPASNVPVVCRDIPHWVGQ